MKFRRDKYLSRITCYADSVHKVLNASMGILGDTAEITPRNLYRKLALRRQSQSEWLEGVDDWNRQFRNLFGNVSEQEVLAEVCRHSVPRPSLIIGQAGAGKTCLLESWALQLASELRRASSVNRTADPRVPLLVSLPRLRGRRLMDYVRQHAEADLVEGLPGIKVSLGEALIDRLLDEQHLVCLLDGFDEVPLAERDQLATEIKRLATGIPTVVASRPGHGEFSVVAEASQIVAIAEFTTEDALRYLETYFHVNQRRGEEECADRLMECIEQLTGPLEAWIKRPLFLKAFCDHVVAEGQVPRTIGQLGWQLLRATMLRRPVTRGWLIESIAADPQLQAARLDAFADWMGQLSQRFAEKDFSPMQVADLRDEIIQESTEIGQQSVSPNHLAIEAGLIVYSNRQNRLRLLKTPVVEFLVGRSLAKKAATTTGEREFLVLFRRWIWRHPLHNILDFAFDGLWHGSTEQRSLASELLQWVVDVGRHDATRWAPERPLLHDDLVHPFVTSALRWHALNTNPSEVGAKSVIEAADEVGPALMAALRAGVNPNHLFAAKWALPIVRSLVGSLHFWRDNSTDSSIEVPRSSWNAALSAAAASVSSRDARRWTEDFVNFYISEEEGLFHREAYLNALTEAARQIPGSEVPETMRQWRVQRDVAERESHRQAWDYAMVGLASQVLGSDARLVAKDLLQRSKVAPNELILRTLGARLISTSREDVIVECMRHFEGALPEFVGGWAGLIRGAASGLSAAAAMNHLPDWLSECPITAAGKTVIAAAILGASQNCDGADAERLLPILFSSWIAAEAPDMASAIGFTIGSAVPEAHALHIAEELLNHIMEEDGIDVIPFTLTGVLRRIPQEIARAFVDRVMFCFDRAAQTQIHDLTTVWEMALQTLGTRLLPGHALALFETAVNRLRISGDTHWVHWWRTIAITGERLERSQIPAAIDNLLEHFDSRFNGCWSVIGDIAVRANHPGGIKRIATRLLHSSCPDSVLRVVAEHRALAVVSLEAENVGDAEYHLVSRADQTMDPAGAAAPMAIRRRLAGNIELTFEHEELLRALSDYRQEAEQRKDASYAWRSMTQWFDKAHVWRQRVNPQDLISVLQEHGWVESRSSGKLTKYRLTDSGMAYLRRRSSH